MNMEKVLHRESQETRDFIADWIAPDFFYSKKDVWHRFGFLGVFTDYVLSCMPGNVAEIGVGESSIYLSHVARKYGRKIFHCDVARGKIVNPLTVDGYLTKEAVFPHPNDQLILKDNSLFFIGTSDDFFNSVDMEPLALTFIDGDHLYPQVKKDFWNAVYLTVSDGYILLHDTYPPSEDYVREERCGSVFMLRQEIERDARFDCLTLTRGTAIGVGLTIVRVKPKERVYYQS